MTATPPAQTDNDVVLEVRDLRVWFPIRKGVFSRTIGATTILTSKLRSRTMRRMIACCW